MMLVLPLTPWKPDGIVCTSFYGHTQDAKGMPEWVRDVLRKANLWGDWVDTQRQFRKKGKLSEERIGKLKRVPGWVWKPQQK